MGAKAKRIWNELVREGKALETEVSISKRKKLTNIYEEENKLFADLSTVLHKHAHVRSKQFRKTWIEVSDALNKIRDADRRTRVTSVERNTGSQFD